MSGRAGECVASSPFDDRDVDRAGALAQLLGFGVFGRRRIAARVIVAWKFDHDVTLVAIAFHDLAPAAADDRLAFIFVEGDLRFRDVLGPLLGIGDGSVGDNVSLGHALSLFERGCTRLCDDEA